MPTQPAAEQAAERIRELEQERDVLLKVIEELAAHVPFKDCHSIMENAATIIDHYRKTNSNR